jgi:PPOX class probable F420-dependent enzyme
MWDPSTPFGQRIEAKLNGALIIWLVTSSGDGTPQPSPVWFLREGDTLLIYSKPDAPKLRNIGAHPRVALHFDTDPNGNDVIIFHGTAAVDGDAPPADRNGPYLEKYRAGIADIEMTPESFAAGYSTPIRVRLEKVRGF